MRNIKRKLNVLLEKILKDLKFWNQKPVTSSIRQAFPKVLKTAILENSHQKVLEKIIQIQVRMMTTIFSARFRSYIKSFHRCRF